MPTDTDKPATVASPLAKFTIGLIAGCSAILVPRLTSFLSTNSGNTDLIYFTNTYVAAVVAFSVVLGTIIAITEWKLPKPPKETFFAALAIPGLIVGSLNTMVESDSANDQLRQISELQQEVQNDYGIEVETLDSIEVLSLDFEADASIKPGSQFSFDLISSAHAADLIVRNTLKKNQSLNFSVLRNASKYAISLGSFSDKNQAVEFARKLRREQPNVTLIKAGETYQVLSGNTLMTQTNATLAAVKIRRAYDLQPKIVKIK